jgi:hypothetical protein
VLRRFGAYQKDPTAMKRSTLFLMTLGLLPLMPAASFARDDTTPEWKTIIGIEQAGNVVDGVTGGGQPWSALGGEASVDLRTGEVAFAVHGLVLAGGNSIGTPGAVASVAGTVVCGVGVSVATPQVTLSPQGDAEFDGIVAVPVACKSSNIGLLLTAPNGQWIANASVRR